MFRRRPLGNLTDQDLVALAGAGDSTAFAEAYDRHSALALGLANRILRDRTAAEDAVQEAFLSAWRGLPAFDPARGNLRNWILSIVRHRSIDAARSRQRLSAQTTGSEDDRLIEALESGESTSGQAEQHDLARSLRSAIDELPPDQRSAIDLAYFEGLTHSEIAARLDLPLGTVKGRMRLALDKLRLSCEPSHG